MSPPGVPTPILEIDRTRPMEIAPPGSSPATSSATASATHTDMRMAAAVTALTTMVEVFGKTSTAPTAGAPVPGRGLPAWLSILFVTLFGTGGLAGGMMLSKPRVDALEAAQARMQLDWAAMQATIKEDREALHRNDAALGKWAVDMTREVGEGLLSLDQLSRAIAEAQGVDTTAIAKPAITKPGVTVRQLGLQAEAEGL